jgi:disulfide bond formation protein DsbB
MSGASADRDSSVPTRSTSGWIWLSAAWAFALVSTFAALFIGEVMGMTPCQLCWYQRILMFPLAVILGMAAFGSDRRGATYALPLAMGGVAIAAYHTALVAGWVPQWWIPCGAGPSCSDQKLVILGNIQIPWLSLLAFSAISALLLVYLRKTRS